jgi:RimJ/RimL family protein N-acetyltransferase
MIRVLGADDVAPLQAFLRRHLESSLFLLGNLNLAGIDDDDRMYSGTYVGRVDGGRLIGAAALYWNGNMMVQAPEPGDAVALARAALAASPERGLKGLIGPDEQVIGARDGLGLPHSILQLDSRDLLYRLDLDALVVPGALASGAVTGRRAEPRDLDTLTAWRVDYEVTLMHADDTAALRDDARKSIANMTGEQRLWVLERDGSLVAMTGFNTRFEDIVQVGGVYTPAALRGRGHARAGVAASLLDAEREGSRRSILFTGDHNLAAQRVYEVLGYRPIGSYRLTLLREPWHVGKMGSGSI